MPGSTRLTLPLTTLPTTLLSRSRSMCSSANCLSSSNATRVSPRSALMMISFCIVPPEAVIRSSVVWLCEARRMRDRVGPPLVRRVDRLDLRCREKVAGWPTLPSQRRPGNGTGDRAVVGAADGPLGGAGTRVAIGRAGPSRGRRLSTPPWVAGSDSLRSAAGVGGRRGGSNR